jgi:hypothetical protein
MAKEEKPLEYQRRIRDTKGVAQRLDLNYLRRPGLLAVLRNRITWAAVVIGAVASVPFVTGFGGSRRAVMSGDVSAAHAVFENKCESCHTTAFASVPDSACQTCHDGAPHPAKAVDHGRANATVRCAQCHLDHQGRGQLAKVASGNCTSCHSNLGAHATGVKVKDVAAFRAGRHPEFSTASMTDARPLRLNHAIHMPAAPKTIRGMKLPMKCADCHVTKGGELLPVTFEQNCKSCHARELEFDVHQTLGPKAAPAPHTRDPKTVREFVVAAYRGRPGADQLVKDAEEYLFGRKCGYCHEGGGPDVRKVGTIGGEWFQRAEFKHRSHRAVACESCHASARSSMKTADVLIPKMESCLPCHADSQAGLDRCGVCHQYHNRALEMVVVRKFGGTR